MVMNNAVKNWQGKVIGYRCFRCGDIVGSMWGNICNKCRDNDDKQEEMMHEIRLLRKELSKYKKT
jgi:hypothetical protein